MEAALFIQKNAKFSANLSLNNGVRGGCIEVILLHGWPHIPLPGSQSASQGLSRGRIIRPPLGDTPSSSGERTCGIICGNGDSGMFLICLHKPLLTILATNPIFFFFFNSQ